MKKKSITFSQAIDIHAFLVGNIEELDTGLCRYKNGLNDASVAEKFGVSVISIATIRKQKFGNLIRTAVSGDSVDTGELYNALNELQIRHNLLVDILAQRVPTMDVRQVKVDIFTKKDPE